MENKVILEPAAQAVSENASKPPLIFQLPPEQGREVLENLQNEPVIKCPATIQRVSFDTKKHGQIPVYLVEPICQKNICKIIYYIHGAGWVFGSFHTHEKLVRELAARTGALVVFPEYTRSPEARYPVAIEQCYSALCDLPSLIEYKYPSINLQELIVAGDSVGGNMAIAMTLMAKFRKGPHIHKQLLFYPVTNACFDTCSYHEFATDYYLYREGMMWFWDQYAPEQWMRNKITASPLRACIDELRGLPPAMIINGEADVLRDEGEAYGRMLRMAGVDVTAIRILGMIHDFVMLNALDQTNACRAAMNAAVDFINEI